jgi:hypothetical protein
MTEFVLVMRLAFWAAVVLTVAGLALMAWGLS